MLRKIGFYALVVFYVIAGVNHFINPGFYLDLIPPYLPWHEAINILSGLAEILLGLALLIPSLRQKAVWAIVLMLIAFIPAHVYFIQIGSCVEGGLCTTALMAWLRLVLIHPLLLLWAWSYRNYGKTT